MERALGMGDYFLRATDPAALGAWYRDCLGLDARLAQLGADVAEETQDMEGVGRFGWVTDPEVVLGGVYVTAVVGA
jgi:hypothetical protein